VGPFLPIWVIVAMVIIPQACGTYWTDRARIRLLERFQGERKSRVIAMIHRQETVSVFGVPVGNFIDIEDSEEILAPFARRPSINPSI
jgi:ClpP class serine protease